MYDGRDKLNIHPNRYDVSYLPILEAKRWVVANKLREFYEGAWHDYMSRIKSVGDFWGYYTDKNGERVRLCIQLEGEGYTDTRLSKDLFNLHQGDYITELDVQCLEKKVLPLLLSTPYPYLNDCVRRVLNGKLRLFPRRDDLIQEKIKLDRKFDRYYKYLGICDYVLERHFTDINSILHRYLKYGIDRAIFLIINDRPYVRYKENSGPVITPEAKIFKVTDKELLELFKFFEDCMDKDACKEKIKDYIVNLNDYT